MTDFTTIFWIFIYSDDFYLRVYQMSEDSSEATNLLDTAIISYETSGNIFS